MKKPLAVLLLSAATVAALAVPAGAAVPGRPASMTVPCNDGSGKSARIWNRPGQLAAKNSCKGQWLMLGYGHVSAGGVPDSAYVLAPGVHFNWGPKQHPPTLSTWALGDAGCGSPANPVAIYGYNDLRQPPCN